jgi:hypothetical protein
LELGNSASFTNAASFVVASASLTTDEEKNSAIDGASLPRARTAFAAGRWRPGCSGAVR